MPRRAPTPRSPRAHWLLLGTVLVVLCGLLGLDVLITGPHDGGDRPSGSRQFVPPAAYAGGSIIDPREPTVRHPPPRTLALTVVDGPDPQWTPQVLDVLARHGVRATFFVSGARAAQQPRPGPAHPRRRARTRQPHHVGHRPARGRGPPRPAGAAGHRPGPGRGGRGHRQPRATALHL